MGPKVVVQSCVCDACKPVFSELVALPLYDVDHQLDEGRVVEDVLAVEVEGEADVGGGGAEERHALHDGRAVNREETENEKNQVL